MSGSPFDTEKVLNDVREERMEQIRRGFTPDHDTAHDPWDFGNLISGYTRLAIAAADQGDRAATRERFVQVAALAVAAIETLDRA